MAELPPRKQGGLLRLLTIILSRTRGRAWTTAHLVEIRQMIRFSSLFLLTVVLPGLALAYFGLASVQAEALRVEEEVRDSGRRMADAAWTQVDSLFQDFEASTRVRLASGQSPLESLRDLSDSLLVGFRLDREGGLTAPFKPPEADLRDEHSPIFSAAWRAAIAQEHAGGDPDQAVRLLRQAEQETRGVFARGEARYALGRALLGAERFLEADQLLAEVAVDYAHTRNVHGFKLGHLARLKLGESWLARTPEKGQQELQNLVQDLIGDRWVIGQGGDPAVAARALDLLEDVAPRDWISSHRGRLEEKTQQLFWSEHLLGGLAEIQAVASGVPAEGSGFFYRVGDRALWATTWWGEEMFAFALDLTGLRAQLQEIVNGVSKGGGEASVMVLTPLEEPPSDAFGRRTLAPFLPGWSLIFHPVDADHIRSLKTARSRQQVTIILLSLLVIGVGGFLSIRMVRRELDMARMKADFAATVSHELRSPITQIRLKGESLQLGLAEDQADLEEHYDVIVQEAERLSRLVDNVLDFSSIERGAKRYDRRAGNVGETVRIAVEAARFTMETRGLTMDMDIPEGLPVVFHDPDAIGQVVQNLVSNAAKYGMRGGWIGVKARIAPKSVDIAVSDRGIGIDAEELPLIFEKFYRSDDPDARREKGTGIGLTICQYIMTAHQGAISVRSAKGKGTTFTLHFPIRPPESSGL
jgi:signal transduction histidine kinase